MTEFAHLPIEDRQQTVRSMFPGEVFYPPQEILTFDPASKEVIIYGTSEFEKRDIHPKSIMGKIAITRAFAFDENDNVIDGYVVDIRHIDKPIETDDYGGELPDDPEEQNYWASLQKERIKISGLVHLESGKIAYDGNRFMHAAALDLAQNTDRLKASLKATEPDSKKAHADKSEKKRTKSTTEITWQSPDFN